MKNINKEKWNNYISQELSRVKQTLDDLGYTTDEKQVHISGERHLMSGYKLVLIGKSKKTDDRVIIKISSEVKGRAEIEHEHKARIALSKIDFAYHAFKLPRVLLFTEYDGFLISITKYIKESLPFLKHSSIEQFFLTLRALETQEGAQITTYSHKKRIDSVFGILSAKDYIIESQNIVNSIKEKDITGVKNSTIDKANSFLVNNKKILKIYSDFLTHSDFVPHNLRIVDNNIYLLDHTSIHFGNKYEGWARIMNYMLLYNTRLERYLGQYVRNNRGDDEYLSLVIMRVYKLLFLINYYCDSYKKTEGNLLLLTKKRIEFWQMALESIMLDDKLSDRIVNVYKKERDNLRSSAELERQKKLNQIM